MIVGPKNESEEAVFDLESLKVDIEHLFQEQFEIARNSTFKAPMRDVDVHKLALVLVRNELIRRKNA